MNDTFRLDIGEVPLLVSMPHCGTALTPAVEAGLNDEARTLADTDWHIPELYSFIDKLGASRLQAHYSRYVVDLNRPEDDTPLYAGATTGLFPDIDFDGRPLFAEGRAPSQADHDWALEHVWRPYHQALASELARLKQRFGYALLFDAHSIRSQVPRLFDGRLPDLNLGTYEDRSCDPALTRRLQTVCQLQSSFTYVVNGRFKGGHITRHYNNPQLDIHGVQLELSQHTYMHESPPFVFDKARADEVRPLLQQLLTELLAWGEAHYV